MKLKSIRAYGFKSFADKMDMEFKTNITAIVGPNGSGKSNIVDAVRWVLGEQSVKSLRGSSTMSDVIFAGSETRDPLKRAEVALLFDNTDHFLNTELKDVEVKRILYRTGENEYFINNAKVRLKDITSLFLDSGIGSDTLNIITQGSIETIVNSKPLDRRIILESAAKVLKYKTRKQESEKKLEKTKDNLEKVTLVTDELKTTVEPLKEQSEKAKKYLELKGELEDLEISLTTYDLTKMNEVYEQLLREAKDLEEKKEKINFSADKESTKTESLRLEQLQIEEKIKEENQKLISLNDILSGLASEKILLLERQNYVVSNEKLDESILALKEQEIAYQKELALLKEEIVKLEEERKKIAINLGEKEEQESILTIKKRHLDTELEQEIQNNFTLKNKIQLLETNIEQDMTLPSSVKNVIHNPRLKGLHGTIGKLIEVEDTYSLAIDTALGASANFIVTENEFFAKEAIEYLKKNHLGRTTFFPLNIIKSRMIDEKEKNLIQNEPGIIGLASNLVHYDPLYQNIIENQLGNIIVVQNMDTMLKVSKKWNYKYRLVSLDGEIMHQGGSLTGGSLKEQRSTLKEKQELTRLKTELENNEISLTNSEKKKEELLEEKKILEETIEKLEKDLWKKEEEKSQKEKQKETIENKLKEVQEKNKGANTLKEGSIEEQMIKLLESQKENEIKKELCEKSLAELQERKSSINDELTELDNLYREKNAEYHTILNDLKNHEVEIGKLDTKMDYLFQLLNEEYHLTYEKAKMDYSLDIEVDLARMKVTSLKGKIKELGEVNLGSISEYERMSERYNFLMSQKKDLEEAIEELYQMINEMDTIMEERLKSSFEKIEKEFKITFKKLFKGGTGLLKLTDPDNILETGIEIIAEPPGKKLNNIQLLSGGEKTLTAIALLFAILNVYPVPFCILDEIEAALDEANVDTFGAYLQEQQDKSEFILITHKKRTMEYATTLYGITMQEQGVSKIVSVSLEK